MTTGQEKITFYHYSYFREMLQILSLESSDGGNYGCSAVTDFPCTTVQSDNTQVTSKYYILSLYSNNIFAIMTVIHYMCIYTAIYPACCNEISILI